MYRKLDQLCNLHCVYAAVQIVLGLLGLWDGVALLVIVWMVAAAAAWLLGLVYQDAWWCWRLFCADVRRGLKR